MTWAACPHAPSPNPSPPSSAFKIYFPPGYDRDEPLSTSSSTSQSPSPSPSPIPIPAPAPAPNPAPAKPCPALRSGNYRDIVWCRSRTILFEDGMVRPDPYLAAKGHPYPYLSLCRTNCEECPVLREMRRFDGELK